MKEMVGGCCVCSDDRGWPENPLVYCDGQSCTVAVHQACYGIVTVPTGPWYCRKCESQERSAKVKCELCPSKYGALKRTDNGGWAHVVCALYIPEVRFGNVTTMEPIQLQLIPTERFSKVCYICEENGKASNASVGACMQCNKSGCKHQFHVTCAQGLGLLCEEAGNYLDNVKYCGYCQHHYSKLKKGGNVKTIPPYRPVSTENHLSDSNSEKETEANSTSNTGKSSSSHPSSSGKRKSSSNNKNSSSSAKLSSSTNKTNSSSSSHQKTVHNSTNKSEKDKIKVLNASIKSAKITEEASVVIESNIGIKSEKTVSSQNTPAIKETKSDIVDTDIIKPDPKEVKSAKKRKANSRTPTPLSIAYDSVSVVLNPIAITVADLNTSVTTNTSTINTTASIERRDTLSSSDSLDKPKKAKTERLPSPIVVLQSTIVNTTLSSAVKNTPPRTASETVNTTSSVTSQSIIQSTSTPAINSLVVSVPLVNTNLSPHPHIANNQTGAVAIPPPFSHLPQEFNSSTDHSSSSTATNVINMAGGNSNQGSGTITTEMSGGGLKITYEKQPVASSSTLQMELERITPTESELPLKRYKSQPSDKPEKGGRNKKRGTNSTNNQYNNTPNNVKRNSRSQHITPPLVTNFTNALQNPIKESPPSSPSSESQGASSTTGRRSKGRKSVPGSVSSSSNLTKDSKDGLKVFQNGITAPHMMGNQLNPNSNMAQKMTDHLNSELEAHSIFTPNDNSNLVGPQLHHRVIASARSSSTGGSSTASGGSGFSSMLGNSGNIPQTLDQLLERQWEQGSQFLMEQAQHFDIASLLSCLHQLRAENLRLEEHVSSLLQRRDHLLAVNARLAIPLTGQPATAQSSHPHTVNNIHPAVAASHPVEVPRSRHSSAYSSHGQHSAAPIENGLPTDPTQSYPHQHRSPAGNTQPSPTVRHSPANSGYPNSGMVRQNTDNGRSAPRPQPYPLYQGPGPSSSQPQMVIRRESELHHQPSSKPS